MWTYSIITSFSQEKELVNEAKLYLVFFLFLIMIKMLKILILILCFFVNFYLWFFL